MGSSLHSTYLVALVVVQHQIRCSGFPTITTPRYSVTTDQIRTLLNGIHQPAAECPYVHTELGAAVLWWVTFQAFPAVSKMEYCIGVTPETGLSPPEAHGTVFSPLTLSLTSSQPHTQTAYGSIRDLI